MPPAVINSELESAGLRPAGEPPGLSLAVAGLCVCLSPRSPAAGGSPSRSRWPRGGDADTGGGGGRPLSAVLIHAAPEPGRILPPRSTAPRTSHLPPSRNEAPSLYTKLTSRGHGQPPAFLFYIGQATHPHSSPTAKSSGRRRPASFLPLSSYENLLLLQKSKAFRS